MRRVLTPQVLLVASLLIASAAGGGLSATAAWTIEGDQLGAQLGSAGGRGG